MNLRLTFAAAVSCAALTSPAHSQSCALVFDGCAQYNYEPGCVPVCVDTADGSRMATGASAGYTHQAYYGPYPAYVRFASSGEFFGALYRFWFHPQYHGEYLCWIGAEGEGLHQYYTVPTAPVHCVDCFSVPGAPYGYRCVGSYSVELLPRDAEDLDMRSGCPANVGLPVSVTTGNVWLDQTDASIPGLGSDLVFQRSYNSLNGYRNRGGILGPGWHHSFERTVTVTSTSSRGLILRGGDGVPLYFLDKDNPPDNVYTPRAPATDQSWIVKQPTTNDYVRHFRAGGSEEYDVNGRLAALVDRWGNRTTLTWLGSQLKTIAAEGGRVVSVKW